MVHSCSFDTTLSFACQESLNVGLFAVKPRHFLLFYCQRKYSVCMCVQVKLLLYVHACVHAVIVLGLREMPCVSMYRREGEGDGARQW